MNLYELLGVPRDADAKAIKAAYRRAARAHHPDMEGGDTAKFQQVKRAYDILNDPLARKRYDETGDTEIRSRESGAIQGLAELVLHLLQKAENVDTLDLHKIVHDTIARAAHEQRHNLGVIRRQIAKMERARARLGKRGQGENIMVAVVESAIRDLNAKVDQALALISSSDEMQRLWSEYTYRHDAEPAEWTTGILRTNGY